MQKEKVKQFSTFTGASERVATDLLKRFDWNLEPAVDSYFANGGRSLVPQVDQEKIAALFLKLGTAQFAARYIWR